MPAEVVEDEEELPPLHPARSIARARIIRPAGEWRFTMAVIQSAVLAGGLQYVAGSREFAEIARLGSDVWRSRQSRHTRSSTLTLLPLWRRESERLP